MGRPTRQQEHVTNPDDFLRRVGQNFQGSSLGLRVGAPQNYNKIRLGSRETRILSIH